MKKLVLLFTVCLMVIGCEKDVIDQMEAYYTESMGLQGVTIDSVKTFSNKVNNYVTQFPEEKEHHLYPKIQANIKSASLRITITADTTWAGETHINF